jgi:polyhydroxybutyrate depolymerase
MKKLHVIIAASLLGIVVNTGANVTAKPSPEQLKPGVTEVIIEHEGLNREMLIHLPERYDPAKKYPVIFWFHGAGGPMRGVQGKLAPTVEKHNVIGVSPQGLADSRGVTGFNAFNNNAISSADDVGLVRKIFSYLKKNASIDTSRIYATGGSNGGIFCYRLALETEIFAAIAPQRAGMLHRHPLPENRPRISILHIIGTDDKLHIGGQASRDEVFYSSQETLALWAKNHNVKTEPASETTGNVVVTRFSSEEDSFELILYAINGEGHRIPREISNTFNDLIYNFLIKYKNLSE